MPELPEVETVMRGLRARLEGRTIVRAEVNRADLRWPLPRGSRRPPDGGARARLPATRQVHPHAHFRRRQPAAPSRHVRPDRARGGRDECSRPARACGAGDRRRMARRLRRSAPVRLDRPRADRRGGQAPAAGRTRSRAARRRVHAACSGCRVARPPHADQGGAARSAHRRRTRQHLRLRGAVPRAASARCALRAPLSGGGHSASFPRSRTRSTDAITAGGSSLRDYVQPDGELGHFQHAWKVYGREDLPCERCPGPAACAGHIHRITQAGRSTFFCRYTQR